MSVKVTKDLYIELVRAATQAEGPGLCNYAMDSGPCCVIGQLLSIRGASLHFLQELDKMRYNDQLAAIKEAGLVKPGELNALCRVQAMWDSRNMMQLPLAEARLQLLIELGEMLPESELAPSKL